MLILVCECMRCLYCMWRFSNTNAFDLPCLTPWSNILASYLAYAHVLESQGSERAHGRIGWQYFQKKPQTACKHKTVSANTRGKIHLTDHGCFRHWQVLHYPDATCLDHFWTAQPPGSSIKGRPKSISGLSLEVLQFALDHKEVLPTRTPNSPPPHLKFAKILWKHRFQMANQRFGGFMSISHVGCKTWPSNQCPTNDRSLLSASCLHWSDAGHSSSVKHPASESVGSVSWRDN